MTDVQELYQLLPHAGAMRLIDHVLSWDQGMIQCSTATHLCPDNPLRQGGDLPAWSGLEYAAQAFALHGVLVNLENESGESGSLAVSKPVEAYVVTVQEMNCLEDSLLTCAAPLLITANMVFSQGESAVYEFMIAVQDRDVKPRPLVTGSVGVMLSSA